MGIASLTTTLNDLGASTSKRHFAVVWVTTGSGAFIKTLWKQGDGTNFSDPNGVWADHFLFYDAARGISTALDGYSSATATSYAATTPSPPTTGTVNSPVGGFNFTGSTFKVIGRLPKGLSFNSLLGAVAKGYGVDRMVDVLRSHGLENIYASIAGEGRVLGHNPCGTKWNLGISMPVDHWREDNPMAATVAISNQAPSTSGDYQKFSLNASGRRLGHILDARTGMPVQHNLAAVTIVGPDSTTADGMATTLFVLGTEEGKTVRSAQGYGRAVHRARQGWQLPPDRLRQV